MTTGIYKITNLANGKVYIGASRDIKQRWREHKSKTSSPIHSDLEALGTENFKFEVLLECPEDMLCQWERDMICLYDADDPEKGYNSKHDRPYNLKNSESHKGKPSSRKGKPAWNRGIPCPEEQKRRISETLKGRIVSNEMRRRISETLKGRPLSEETRRKMSEVRRGRPLSEEHKRKMKGRIVSEETRRKISEKRKEYWRKKKEV